MKKITKFILPISIIAIMGISAFAESSFNQRNNVDVMIGEALTSDDARGVLLLDADKTIDGHEIKADFTAIVEHTNAIAAATKSNASAIDTANREIAELEATRVQVIDGFNTSSSSYTVTNPCLKNAKTVTVNYSNPAYGFSPTYDLDSTNGKLTVSGLTGDVTVTNIIVYH